MLQYQTPYEAARKKKWAKLCCQLNVLIELTSSPTWPTPPAVRDCCAILHRLLRPRRGLHRQYNISHGSVWTVSQQLLIRLRHQPSMVLPGLFGIPGTLYIYAQRDNIQSNRYVCVQTCICAYMQNRLHYLYYNIVGHISK
jgi:hypothetical protein